MNALDELVAAGGALGQFFTPAYVAQAKAYAEPLRIKALVDLFDNFAIYALIFGFKLHLRLYARCERWTAALAARMPPGGLADKLRTVGARIWRGPGVGTAMLFVLLLELAQSVLGLPEAFYFNFLREKREALSNYSLATWIHDTVKEDGSLLLGTLILLVTLYALMRWLPTRWARVLGGVGAVAMLGAALLDPYRSQLLFDHKPLPDGPERAAIVAVLERARVPFQNVVVENTSRATSRADAYFAGQGPTRLIVLSDTLLGRYTPREIASIVAHEAGHVRESVWPARIASAFALLLGMLLLERLLRTAGRRHWFGLRAPDDIAGYLLLFLLFDVAMVVGGPVSNWRSRLREQEADGYALELTRDPEAFATMMTKLAAQNRSDPVPPELLELWRANHPPPARRIAHALRFAREHAIAVRLPSPQDAAVVAASAAQ